MRAEVSRIYDMGTRVGSFSDTEPDTDPGQAQSVAEVKGLVQQMKVVAAAQRTGLIDRRAGAVEKASLRREVLAGPVTHLAQVGRRASRDVHELGQAFQRKPSKGTYVEFLTASRTMQAEAEQHKAVLLKYGLSEAVLAQLGELLDRFDAAVLLGNNGRTAHKGATQALASEQAVIVRRMDARNRQGNAPLFASWVSARTVLGVGKRAVSVPSLDERPVAKGVLEHFGQLRRQCCCCEASGYERVYAVALSTGS
jgi:hypothetical protein